jgi:hypothetical protein
MNLNEVTQKSNDLGKEGWEAVGMLNFSSNEPNQLLFKRKLP